jgi:hypothetical protein
MAKQRFEFRIGNEWSQHAIAWSGHVAEWILGENGHVTFRILPWSKIPVEAWIEREFRRGNKINTKSPTFFYSRLIWI